MDEQPTTPEGYPRAFGSYVLLTAFAHGGMGEVYLAKTGGIEGIERVCVLKKLRPDFGQNPEYVNRFLDEARLVVQLNHANIAHVFDVGRVAGEYYLAMEYVSGVSVRALMTRAQETQKTVPPDVALFVVSESLEALDYAHRLEHPLTGKPLHLVHRDVSPHNVMVSYEGEVKLIDFGLAASELKEEQTESQVVMGKVAYMSPEQARGERVDSRCDQFAAAIVLYELLTDDRYYGEMSNYQIWQVVGRGGFTPRKWTTLDPALQNILGKALHGDPKQRFATCGDFREALSELLIERHPRTTRRTVRETVRAFFDGDTEKERTFLQRLAHVSAAAAREASNPVATTQSYSIVRAPGSSPPGPAPGQSLSEQPETEATHTHLLARKRAEGAAPRSRPAALAGLALLVAGVLTGYLLVRPAPPAPPRTSALGAEPAATENVETTPPAIADATPAADAGALVVAAARAEPTQEAGDEAKGTAPKAETPARPPPPVPSRPPQKSQAPVADEGSTAAPPAPAAAPSPAEREAAAWRARVVKRIERCAPCQLYFEGKDLRVMPLDDISAGLRVSVETCLRQCD